MIKRILLLILLFYVLVLLQTAVLFNFPLVIIAVVLINVFYNKESFSAGIASAFIGGFFLDIFSSGTLGIWTLILVASSCCFQLIFKKYVRTSLFKT